MLTEKQVWDALIALRKEKRPNESDTAFAKAAKFRTSSQVQTVMKGSLPKLPKMEGWVRACGYTLSQFIAKLEMEHGSGDIRAGPVKRVSGR